MSSPAPLLPGQVAMYEEFYRFGQPPFTLAPDPRFLYRSESHDEALTLLLMAIRRREGFVVLSGDIGTGKTTLCRALLQQLDVNTFTSLVLNPFLSIEELLREILLDFGVVSREAVRSGRLSAASKHELVRTLHEFLLSLGTIRGYGVLIIDEAQHLSPEVLEELRVISNLETNETKLLQVVLVGQLNLLDVLATNGMRQLQQRISLQAVLKPLTRDEVEAYIGHRLWVAKGTEAVAFSTPSVDEVHRFSGGIPRIINLLCDRALMIGADMRLNVITPAIIRGSADKLGLKTARSIGRIKAALAVPPFRPSPRQLVAGVATVVLLTLLGMLAPLGRLVDTTPPSAPEVPQLRLSAPVTIPAPPLVPIEVRIRTLPPRPPTEDASFSDAASEPVP